MSRIDKLSLRILRLPSRIISFQQIAMASRWWRLYISQREGSEITMQTKISSHGAVFSDHQEFFPIGPAESSDSTRFPLDMLVSEQHNLIIIRRTECKHLSDWYVSLNKNRYQCLIWWFGHPEIYTACFHRDIKLNRSSVYLQAAPFLVDHTNSSPIWSSGDDVVL